MVCTHVLRLQLPGMLDQQISSSYFQTLTFCVLLSSAFSLAISVDRASNCRQLYLGKSLTSSWNLIEAASFACSADRVASTRSCWDASWSTRLCFSTRTTASCTLSQISVLSAPHLLLKCCSFGSLFGGRQRKPRRLSLLHGILHLIELGQKSGLLVLTIDISSYFILRNQP